MVGRHILRAAYGGGSDGVALFMTKLRSEFESAMVRRAFRLEDRQQYPLRVTHHQERLTMKRFSKITGLLALGCLMLGSLQAQAPNTLTKQETAAGWKLLFDGSTLKGWETHAAATAWRVADGAILCDGDRAGWLGTADTFTDYNLKVEFRVAEKANSGVFLRSQKEGGPAVTGYELQIWDFRPTYKTGALVDAIEAEPTKILADQWNSYDVTADGDHFIVVLNGKKVLDGHDSKHASGVVGLQYNTGGGKVEFRNIKIKPIKH
jgi:hypothetical protein